jgi:ferrous iron transport protein A
MTQCLWDIQKGQRGKIMEIAYEDLALKMAAFGFVKGAEVMVVERAPFGDPMIVEVAAIRLIIRKSEALLMAVQPL